MFGAFVFVSWGVSRNEMVTVGDEFDENWWSMERKDKGISDLAKKLVIGLVELVFTMRYFAL